MLWYSMVCASVSFFRVIEFRGIEGASEGGRREHPTILWLGNHRIS